MEIISHVMQLQADTDLCSTYIHMYIIGSNPIHSKISRKNNFANIAIATKRSSDNNSDQVRNVCADANYHDNNTSLSRNKNSR